MFFKLFALFAVLAVAFANPNPKPDPALAYAAPAVLPVGYTGYSAFSPLAYSAPYAGALPYAYNYYVR